jgi:DNA-binding response OmpR family regulator
VPVALVVDDDPVILVMAKQVLGDEGFDVHTATTAVDAMACVRRMTVDLLLVDLVLPELDGFALISGIRGLRLAPHARVVVISGCDDEQALSRGRELAIDGYLVKPVNDFDLVNVARGTATVALQPSTDSA